MSEISQHERNLKLYALRMLYWTYARTLFSLNNRNKRRHPKMIIKIHVLKMEVRQCSLRIVWLMRETTGRYDQDESHGTDTWLELNHPEQDQACESKTEK